MKKSTVIRLKNTAALIMIISAVFLFPGLILFIIGIVTSNTFLINAIFLIILGAGLFLLACLIAQLAKHYCGYCFNPLYGCEYGYQEKRRYFKNSSSRESADKLMCDVEIFWVCPHCNRRSAITKSYDMNKSNVEYSVGEYCRKWFSSEKHMVLDEEQEKTSRTPQKPKIAIETNNIIVQPNSTPQQSDKETQYVFCQYCGAKNTKDNKSCTSCSAVLASSSKSIDELVIREMPIISKSESTQNMPYNNSTNYNGEVSLDFKNASCVSDTLAQVLPVFPIKCEPTKKTGSSTSIFALLGLIFAFVVAPVGLILSVVGVIDCKKNSKNGLIMSIIGIVFGLIFSVFFCIVVYAIIVTLSEIETLASFCNLLIKMETI